MIPGARHCLRYESIHKPGRALSFPCDPSGTVFMDALSERALENLRRAQLMVGAEYANPRVVLAEDVHAASCAAMASKGISASLDPTVSAVLRRPVVR